MLSSASRIVGALMVALLAATGCSSGDGAAVTTTGPGLTNTTSTSTATTALPTTTGGAGGTTSTGATIDMPATIGEYGRVDIDVSTLVGELPFAVSGVALYGRDGRPEYLVLLAGDGALAGADPQEVIGGLAAGLSEGTEVDSASVVEETAGSVTFSCLNGTAEAQPFAACAIQDGAKFGIVFSIPGVGPSDIATALALAKLMPEI